METTDIRYTMTETLDLGPVELTVADLQRSLSYYTGSIGLQLLAQDTRSAWLGVPGRPLAVLREIPGAAPAPSSSPGLSHFAPKVPTRADLARFAEHYLNQGRDGDLRDHSNAQSCYVSDPDGHTVEVTCARPRERWRMTDGKPAIVADPMEMHDLMDEPGADAPFTGLPAATTMGHVQLKVTDQDLADTEAFYRDVLGLDVLGRLGNTFAAFGVDDRPLLVVTNRFSQGSSEPAPAQSAHLLGVDLLLPTPGDVQALAAQLEAAGYPHELRDDVLEVRDPSSNPLRFRAR